MSPGTLHGYFGAGSGTAAAFDFPFAAVVVADAGTRVAVRRADADVAVGGAESVFFTEIEAVRVRGSAVRDVGLAGARLAAAVVASFDDEAAGATALGWPTLSTRSSWLASASASAAVVAVAVVVVVVTGRRDRVTRVEGAFVAGGGAGAGAALTAGMA